MWRMISVILAVVSMLDVRLMAQRPTLRDQVRNDPVRTEPLLINSIGSYPTRDIDSLSKEADLVIIGVVDRAMSELTRDERSVQTVSDLKNIRVIARNTVKVDVPTQAIRQLRVIQPGGQVDVDGRLVIVDVSEFRPLPVGRNVLLFLKQLDDEPEGTFYIIGGPYGQFEVQGQQLFSLVRESVSVAHKHDGTDVETFAKTVQSLTPRRSR